MKKPELLEMLAEEMEVSKTTAEVGLIALTETIKSTLAKGEEFNVPGLGKFKPKKLAARTVRNPKTGEPLQVPARTAVKFSPAASFKEAL